MFQPPYLPVGGHVAEPGDAGGFVGGVGVKGGGHGRCGVVGVGVQFGGWRGFLDRGLSRDFCDGDDLGGRV